MNINEKLMKQTRDYLPDYGCPIEKIEDFLKRSGRFEERQKKAIEIIEQIMSYHGKKDLHYQIDDLAKVEFGIRELQPWVRDHVVHAVLSFLLGIYINNKFLNYAVDTFQWKLAGLFHDVGYPVEIAKDVLNPISKTINDHKTNLGIKRDDIKFEINPKGLLKLQKNNSLDLIQQQLNNWNLKINARTEYEKTLESDKLCHGIISSLLVLYFIDCLYQKYNRKRKHKNIIKIGSNWNQHYFEDDVVPACSAIFIHNLPARCFENAKIDRKISPLVFLLKLSDILQDWERPSEENKHGYEADSYDINIQNRELILEIKVSKRKKEIENEISSCLIAPDVHII